MKMRRFLTLGILAVLVLASFNFPLLTTRAQGDKFFGKTAEELFPDNAFPTSSPEVIKAGRANAFKALMAANIPDGHALGNGKTITIATLGQGSTGGISGTVYFWRPAFEAATGAKLEIAEIPFGQLQTTIPTTS